MDAPGAGSQLVEPKWRESLEVCVCEREKERERVCDIKVVVIQVHCVARLPGFLHYQVASYP